MSSFVNIIVTFTLAIYAVFFLLLFVMRKKRITLPGETKSNMKFLAAGFSLLLIWVVFFEDNKVFFTCEPETKICRYYRATIAQPEIRLSKTYDLSKIKAAIIEKRVKLFQKGHRDYYKIVFKNGAEETDFPKRFDFLTEAETECEKINRFLSGRLDSYKYLYEAPKGILIIFSLMALILFGIIGAAVIAITIYKAPPRNDDTSSGDPRGEHRF